MSTATVDTTLTIRQFVARHPRAREVFQRAGMDTCCGGRVSIAGAAERHGVALESLVSALRPTLD
jgi:iron-sulfur cluster repair protein YtfE (RIC family)